MNTPLAFKINSAVSRTYLFREGLAPSISIEDLLVVRGSTLAQIENAIEVVEAENEAAYSVAGAMIHCTVSQGELARVKAYADAVKIEPDP